MELPAFITAATGMDALTHNMEAYLAKMPHPMCEGIALQGITIIHEALENAVRQPDIESRSKMLIGSLMGAVAFQKGLGAIHTLSHPVGEPLDPRRHREIARAQAEAVTAGRDKNR